MTKASMKREGRSSTSVASTSERGGRGGTEARGPAASSKRAKPPAKGLHGVPGSKNDERRCSATANRTGERCKRAAIKGGNVCTSHGGSLPGVRRAASDRLLAMVEPALLQLRRIIDKDDASDADKLKAVGMVLDRTGFKGGLTVEVGVSAFDQMMTEAIGLDTTGTVEIDRSMDRPALPSRAGGDHSWEDVEQHSTDLTAENFRGQEQADAEEYERGRIRPDPMNVVRGEVVGQYDLPPQREANDPPWYDAEADR